MIKRDIYLLSPLVKDKTISLPMIEFSTVASSLDLSSCDTLMFTSKQAVVTADNIDKSWKNYPTVAIGGATKNKIEELGGTVLYHPKSFYGESLSKDIIKLFGDKKICYLRPKEVSFDSRSYLAKESIDIEEQIIYETSCVKYHIDHQPNENAIIIFTSPSTIKCFFKNFLWKDSYTAILIGEATKEHIPKSVNFIVADKPLIDSCIECAMGVQL